MAASRIATEGEFEDLLGLASSFSGSQFGLNVSGAVEFMQRRRRTDLAVHCVARFFLTNHIIKMTDAVLKTDIDLSSAAAAREFVRKYGPTCVSAVTYGGIFLYDYRFTADTYRTRTMFEAKLDVVLAQGGGTRTGDKDVAKFKLAMKKLQSEFGTSIREDQDRHIDGPGAKVEKPGDVSDAEVWARIHELMNAFGGAVRDNDGERAHGLKLITTPWHLVDRVADAANADALAELRRLCTPPSDTILDSYTSEWMHLALANDHVRNLREAEHKYGTRPDRKRLEGVQKDLFIANRELGVLDSWAKLQKQSSLVVTAKAHEHLRRALKNTDVLQGEVRPPRSLKGVTTGEPTWAGTPSRTAERAYLQVQKGGDAYEAATRRLKKWKDERGAGSMGLIRVQNATSSWMQLHGSVVDYHGRLQHNVHLPDVILPGQVGCFSVQSVSGGSFGPTGVVQYRLWGVDGHELHVRLGWNVPYDGGDAGIRNGLGDKPLYHKKLDGWASDIPGGNSRTSTGLVRGLRVVASCTSAASSYYSFLISSH